MVNLNKLGSSTGCLFALVCSVSPNLAWSDDRIAIIDVAFDTRPFLDQIVDRGVLAIGRYYARCSQPEAGLLHKRLINQGLTSDPTSEISQIAKHDLAILSIYQYYNNSENKFRGRDKSGKILKDGNCRQTSIPRDVTAEAELDASAAISQAKAVGQPIKTAIYFGVDFNFSETDTDTKNLMIAYFQIIKKRLKQEGYDVGAYGSGLAHKILRSAKDLDGNTGLVDYTWISASRAFTQSSEFHRTKKWHLFQNQVDREWFGKRSSTETCSRGLPLDTNLQNPEMGNDIGLWKPQGKYSVDVSRTKAVFDSHRFACDGNAILRHQKTSASSDVTRKKQCSFGSFKPIDQSIGYANSVRLGNRYGSLVEVDIDDDGKYDAWTWTGNLTKNFSDKPDWIFSSSKRRKALCK